MSKDSSDIREFCHRLTELVGRSIARDAVAMDADAFKDKKTALEQLSMWGFGQTTDPSIFRNKNNGRLLRLVKEDGLWLIRRYSDSSKRLSKS